MKPLSRSVYFLVLAVLLVLASSASAQTQTSNSVTLSGQTPPAAPVITVSGPAISPTGKYYCGSALTLTVTATSGTFSTGATVNWNGTALPTTATSSTVLTATVTAAQATCTTNTVTVTQSLPLLTMNNLNTLPNASAGVPYNVNLGSYLSVSGGVQPYTYSISSGSLPTGLSLSASGIVSGTPSGVGTSNFALTVTSSGLALVPAKQFKLEVARLEVAMVRKESSLR